MTNQTGPDHHNSSDWLASLPKIDRWICHIEVFVNKGPAKFSSVRAGTNGKGGRGRGRNAIRMCSVSKRILANTDTKIYHSQRILSNSFLENERLFLTIGGLLSYPSLWEVDIDLLIDFFITNSGNYWFSISSFALWQEEKRNENSSLSWDYKSHDVKWQSAWRSKEVMTICFGLNPNTIFTCAQNSRLFTYLWTVFGVNSFEINFLWTLWLSKLVKRKHIDLANSKQ